VERYRIEGARHVASAGPRGQVRLERIGLDVNAVDVAVAAFQYTSLPWLLETGKFCEALLYVERRTGRSIAETGWRDEASLAGSRSIAAAARVVAV
jgi:hypothetical protein